jgi:excisionase family DNA binding protein
VTPEQAADYCGISRSKLDEWTHRIGFPVIREASTVRIHAALLDEWLRAQAGAFNQPVPSPELGRNTDHPVAVRTTLALT